MRRSSPIHCTIGTVFTVLLFATAASADPTRASPSTPPGDYSYRFIDDPLTAGGVGANDARIVVAGHAVRTTLIRPRMAFIVEMLKSVEGL